MRIEFNTYDNDTFYFLYVTDEWRIETDGIDSLQIEDMKGNIYTLDDNPCPDIVSEAMAVLQYKLR